MIYKVEQTDLFPAPRARDRQTPAQKAWRLYNRLEAISYRLWDIYYQEFLDFCLADCDDREEAP
jgi:hypothetical protein